MAFCAAVCILAAASLVAKLAGDRTHRNFNTENSFPYAVRS
jgi:hypothetical protein